MANVNNWSIIIASLIATGIGLLAVFLVSRRMARARTELRLHHRAIEASVNAIVIISVNKPDYSIEYANHAFERITGYTSEEVLGRSLGFLWGKDSAQPGLDSVRTALREQAEGHAVLCGYRKDNSQFWIDFNISPVPDENGSVTHLVAVFNDVTATKNYEEQLERQLHYDPLTGLPNRNLLQDRLRQAVALAQRQNQLVIVALIDIDNFKFVNESLGHKAGDEVLKIIATRIRNCVRATDTVARLAGDQFVLILTGLVNEDYIPKVLQRVMDAISLHPQVLEELEKVLSTVSRPMVLDNREIDITCSIGVSLFPHDTKDTAVLLRNVAAAVHRAKDLGHNNVQFFTAEMNARMSDRLSLQTMMRRALEREEFELYYQPKINLSDGSISGVEALLRWNSPDRGMIPPVEFIPTLETSGLIIDVGKWILKRAASQYVEWRAKLPEPPRIAVNISQLQLAQKNFTTVVEEIVKSHGLKNDCGLDLEITESLIMQDIDANVSKLKVIRDMGVNISIDDFGTGHSSLSYLTQLPVNAIKIDRSFIMDMVGSSENLAIVLAIISLAHSLKHKVIAEGIDNQAQMDLLRQFGCDEAQGYLIGHPMLARDFEAWYQRWSLSLKPGRSRGV